LDLHLKFFLMQVILSLNKLSEVMFESQEGRIWKKGR